MKTFSAIMEALFNRPKTVVRFTKFPSGIYNVGIYDHHDDGKNYFYDANSIDNLAVLMLGDWKHLLADHPTPSIVEGLPKLPQMPRPPGVR